MDLKFIVQTPPIPKGRPRVTKRGITFTPKRTKDATAVVVAVIKDLLEDDYEPDGTSDFGINCNFYCRLKGHGADVDNLLKLVLDACNGLVWKDDSQVTKLIGEKFLYSEEPRTEVRIWTRTGGG